MTNFCHYLPRGKQLSSSFSRYIQTSASIPPRRLVYFKPMTLSASCSSPSGSVRHAIVFVACLLGCAAALLFPPTLVAAFSLTSSGGFYTVDTNAGLVFKVNQSNGDISSLVYTNWSLV